MAPITLELIHRWANIIKSKPTIIKDTFAYGSYTHLTNLLNNILEINHKPDISKSWFQGFHFLYNNQLNLKLGSDGYDNYQAPVNEQGEQLYLRRLWARGELDFYKTPQVDSPVEVTESLKSVRVIDETVLVSILRNFTSDSQELLRESRTLTYTNELYTANENFHKLDKEDTRDEGPTFHISSVDLLKYSMLTYNLHKIHIDANYCRSIEDLPNVIVHGPLQVTLLLYYFAIKHPELTPKNFRYRTYAPIFINDEVTIQIDPISEHEFRLGLFNKESGKVYIQGKLSSTTTTL
ncbi:Hydroxyacyl-thioester dehydratase type 2, mitochondrial [Candida viswanathii]|uniref:Hydroxyacyl-thioester dehydratase type 2, mitochondrial n=1 Tax=Candida viswanathii TaxID=5486 RepID=A0A367Y929_9ASCO|nr:Hydroxyacyl-thioester dehydratase type 2, mitochondrial [Candida viswanathii]